MNRRSPSPIPRAPGAAASLAALCAVAAIAACHAPIDPGGEPAEEALELDPLLAVPAEVSPGSLDDLYRKVLLPSCAGQPGLCHSGQFEPNLSTPALAYYNLVERPGLEKSDKLRVVPGDPSQSLLMDKLLNRDVISVMPLGARALADDDIAAIEAWITAGARRFDDAEPVAPIDNPPEEPALAIFDPDGERIDLGGAATVSPGETVMMRMTTHDFETPDEEISYAAFILQTIDNEFVVLNPGTNDPTSGYAVLDTAGPPAGGGEVFNRVFTWSVPEEVDLYDADGNYFPGVPTEGQTFIVIGVYIPEDGADYVLALNFDLEGLRVEK